MSNPFADAITELDAPQPGSGTAVASQSVPSSGNPFADAAVELENPQPQADSQKLVGQGTPDNPFKFITTFSEKLTEARQVGSGVFRESSLGHAVANEHMTLEEAEAQIASDDKFQQAQADLQAYEDAAWKNSWLTGIPTSITFTTVKSLPMIEEALKPLAVGAALGGGAAATTGVGLPFVAPVAGMTGTAAAAGWTADLITGQEYLDRRRKGIPHAQALAASNFSGVVQGMLSGLQLGNYGKTALNTAKGVLKAHMAEMSTWIQSGIITAGDAVKLGAFQIASSEAQTATKLIADALAATVSNKPDLIPTLDEAVQEFGKTFQDSLNASLGLFALGKVSGTALGLTGKAFVKTVRQAHDTHLENQRAKIQKIREAESETVNGSVNRDSSKKTETELSDLVGSAPSENALQRQLHAQVRLQKRNAAEAEIRRIFDAAHSMFIIERPETRLAQVGRIQRLLKRYVSNSDLLDDKMKIKLLKRITELDGEKALLHEDPSTLLSAGERFIEDLRGREQANRMLKAQARLDEAVNSAKLKEGKAVLSAAAQATMQFYREFFTLPKIEKTPGAPKALPGETLKAQRQAAFDRANDFVQNGMDAEITKIQSQVNKLDKGELAEIFETPAAMLDKQRVAMEAAQYFSGKMDADAVNSLAEKIEGIVDSGKSEFLERKQANSQKLLKGRADVVDGVNGTKPVVPSQSDTAPKKMTGIGKVVNSLRRNSSSLWDKLLQDLPSDERASLVDKFLDFTEVENREFAVNFKAAEKLASLYTEAVGSVREASRLIRDGMKNEKFDVEYTDLQGNPQKLGRMSMNQLTYLHMAFGDEGALPGLLVGNKYTLEGMVEAGQTSTQEAVRQILSSREGGKYLKLADALTSFYEWFAPIVGNHYLKEYGVEMPISKGYSGQIFHREVEKLHSAADILEAAHSAARQSLNPASTKMRSNSALPIKLVDPFRQVQRHHTQMAFWIANSEKARMLSFIFSDSSKDGLRDIIEHKLGTEFNSLIDSRLAFQFHLKPGIMDIADTAYQHIKSNMATGLLGGRIDQAPKQLTSLLTAMSTHSYEQFIKNLAAASDKKAVEAYVSRSELYKDRTGDVVSQIMDVTKERTFMDALTGDRLLSLKQKGLLPVSWADGVASAIVGFMEYKRVLDAGGTVEEAVRAGDRLVDTTQSSSRVSQKVPAEMDGGIASLSLAFAKQNIQMMNLESGAIRDWLIHKDPKHLNRMVRTMIGIHVATALFQVINSVPAFLTGEDEEKEKAFLRIASGAVGGPYGSMPLIGIDLFYGALSGWKDEQEPRTIIGGLAGDASKLVKQTYEISSKLANGDTVEDEDWYKAGRSLFSVLSVASGLPFWGLFKYTDLGSRIFQQQTEGVK